MEGLFGSDSSGKEESVKKGKRVEKDDNYLHGGSNSGENDSDIDRPPLTEADRRRKANK